jgi:hypothetical protein
MPPAHHFTNRSQSRLNTRCDLPGVNYRVLEQRLGGSTNSAPVSPRGVGGRAWAAAPAICWHLADVRTNIRYEAGIDVADRMLWNLYSFLP